MIRQAVTKDISSDGHCFFFFDKQPFIIRELSQDTDLALYNNMIEIQRNPKYAKFFKQV